MGRSLPAKLTHSTAYLTDKPYDVQLGVLRWIRGLLSEVIDNAASQLSTTAASAAAGSIHNVEPETQGDGGDGACGRSAAGEVGGNTSQQDEGVDGSEALNFKSTAALLDESVGAATTGSRGDGGGSSSTGNGRKRPRTSTPLDRRDIFVPGSVVECFHPVSSSRWWLVTFV